MLAPAASGRPQGQALVRRLIAAFLKVRSSINAPNEWPINISSHAGALRRAAKAQENSVREMHVALNLYSGMPFRFQYDSVSMAILRYGNSARRLESTISPPKHRSTRRNVSSFGIAGRSDAPRQAQ